MVVVAQQWILIKFKVLLAPWCYHEIYCPHCYHEVAPLQLLLIPLRNALVLVCFSAVLYCWIIPLTKEKEHTFIYTLTMPCKTSWRTWLSSSSSTSDIIKLQMSLSLVALWVIPDIPQPRSQGLSSYRPRRARGGKMRDPGNEVGYTQPLQISFWCKLPEMAFCF